MIVIIYPNNPSKCPSCGNTEWYYQIKECPGCHQAIEWYQGDCDDCKHNKRNLTGRCDKDCTNPADWEPMMTPAEAIHKLELHDPKLESAMVGEDIGITITGGMSRGDALEIAEVIRGMLR